MSKLMIQVNGTGMIPRGYGLAPRKEPFAASDIHLINLILNTKGLTVNFVNPETNQLQSVTNKNLKQIWDKYANYVPGSPTVSTSQSKFDPNDWIDTATCNQLRQRYPSEMPQQAEEVVEPSGVDPCVVDAIEDPVAAPADIDNPHHVDESQIESTGADVKSNETTGDSSPTKNNGGNNQNKNGKNKH